MRRTIFTTIARFTFAGIYFCATATAQPSATPAVSAPASPTVPAIPNGSAQAAVVTFEGVSLTPPAGWCASNSMQPAASGSIAALEIRPCGRESPYLSIGVAQIPGTEQELIARSIANVADSASRAFTLSVVQRKWGACTERSYIVDGGGVANVPGFVLRAEYACPSAPGGTTLVGNFATFAQARDGRMFVIAYDSPLAPIGATDAALIKKVVDAVRISRAPPL